MLQKEINNFLQLDTNWKGSADIIDKYFLENSQKIDFLVDRNHLTNILVLYYQQKINFDDLLFWAINLVNFSEYLKVSQSVLDVCLDIELPENYQNLDKNKIKAYLKILWPLGDYSLEA